MHIIEEETVNKQASDHQNDSWVNKNDVYNSSTSSNDSRDTI